MESVLDMAQLPLVDNRGRGEAIQRRRLRLGIDSIHAFADATGKDRGALTRAEAGTASERTYLAVEAWLDAHEHEISSERDDASERVERPGPSTEGGVVTIEMDGVFGIDHVTFSGPADKAEEVRKLALEFWRDLRQADNDGAEK